MLHLKAAVRLSFIHMANIRNEVAVTCRHMAMSKQSSTQTGHSEAKLHPTATLTVL